MLLRFGIKQQQHNATCIHAKGVCLGAGLRLMMRAWRQRCSCRALECWTAPTRPCRPPLQAHRGWRATSQVSCLISLDDVPWVPPPGSQPGRPPRPVLPSLTMAVAVLPHESQYYCRTPLMAFLATPEHFSRGIVNAKRPTMSYLTPVSQRSL